METQSHPWEPCGRVLTLQEYAWSLALCLKDKSLHIVLTFGQPLLALFQNCSNSSQSLAQLLMGSSR